MTVHAYMCDGFSMMVDAGYCFRHVTVDAQYVSDTDIHRCTLRHTTVHAYMCHGHSIMFYARYVSDTDSHRPTSRYVMVYAQYVGHRRTPRYVMVYDGI